MFLTGRPRAHRLSRGPPLSPTNEAPPRPSIRKRLRYRFDNSLARGPLALIGWLGAVVVVIILVAAVVGHFLLTGAEGGFPEDAWQSVIRVLDASAFAGEPAAALVRFWTEGRAERSRRTRVRTGWWFRRSSERESLTEAKHVFSFAGGHHGRLMRGLDDLVEGEEWTRTVFGRAAWSPPLLAGPSCGPLRPPWRPLEQDPSR